MHLFFILSRFLISTLLLRVMAHVLHRVVELPMIAVDRRAVARRNARPAPARSLVGS